MLKVILTLGAIQDESYDVKRQKGPEEYEKNVPSMKTFFRGIKGETLFIVGGSGHISAMCLRIMEQIKDKCEISVLYIRPDTSLLSKNKTLARESDLQHSPRVRSFWASKDALSRVEHKFRKYTWRSAHNRL
jgi:hypothetical protein